MSLPKSCFNLSRLALLTVLASSILPVAGCGQMLSKVRSSDGTQDDTALVQSMVDANLSIPAGKYILRRSILVKQSNTVVRGAGPNTIFVFEPNLPQVQCWNDRAFTTPCDTVFIPNTDKHVSRRRIAGSIAIGDSTFRTADDDSDLVPGDWLIITENDSRVGDVVIVDWAHVTSTGNHTVTVEKPFRTAFPNVHEWEPVRSGLGFFKVLNFIENLQFRDFAIEVPDSGVGAPALSIFAAKHVLVQDVTVTDANGQGLYSYLSHEVTVRNCFSDSGKILSEFAATTDLTLSGNAFASQGDAGLGLDLGTAFFDVSDNGILHSFNSGIYLLYGVHDGTVIRNSVSFVDSSGNAIGILARGTQDTAITNNTLFGGQGSKSLGISIGAAGSLAVPLRSSGNVISPNVFGVWSKDYDPDNTP
ncbi:MAG: hypothetical protein JWN45_2101 [Acidobacteriaceae bacterium]|nr:hypothetical protein [Acidobacteriaceae bacterium]